MGMNPRTLRPSSTFNPRSISGLALWLDAADSSTLYTTDAGPVTAVSAPTEISGCIGWWDASDASSITQSGGLVSQWNDKSGNGRHLSQATSANRPSCTTRTLNGRAVLEFDGSNDLLSLADGSGNPTYGIDIATSRAVTIIAVFASDVTNSIRDLLSLQRTGKNANDTGVYVRRHTNLSGSVEFAAGAGNSTTNDQTDKNNVRGFANTSTDAMMVSFAVSASAGVYAAHMNGAGQSLTLRFGTLPATGFLQEGTGGHTLDIGASRNFGNSLSTSVWDGIVAEVVMFNAALSTADRARVEAYLAAKWGISGVHAPATATNDPVGAWLDKSGNGRHATQATGSDRPAVSATAQNGRRAIAFDGSTDWMRTERTNYLARTVVTVFRRTANAANSFMAVFAKQTGVAVGYGGSSYVSNTEGGWSTVSSASGRMYYNSSAVPHRLSAAYMRGALMPLADAQSSSGGIVAATTTTQPELLYAEAATDSGNQAWFIGTEPFATTRKYPADVLELMIYSSVLSTAERQRIERYLAAKWGIALAPQVSNADAQDWINRVYANGGTVSAATANAVNQFCVDIENAGIRDRFYRLNLFCGTSDASLNAVRTPLFRGQSLAGTQYGNATDTNNNFVQGDYAENDGLLGNSTTKWLNTGFTADTAGLTAESFHMSAVWPSYSHPAGSNYLPIALINAVANIRLWINATSSAIPTTEVATFLGASGTNFASKQIAATNGATISGGLWLTSRTSTASLRLYNGASEQASNTTTLSDTSVPTLPMGVFARWNGTSTFGHAAMRLRGYSVGLGLTAQQVSDFTAAMTTLQTALGRA